jgi:iron(III) transport system substrate-binding protein
MPDRKSLVVLFFLLAFSSPLKGAEKISWERVVAGANEEGRVTLYAQSTLGRKADPFEIFHKSYPGVKVSAVTAAGNEITNRIMTERRAGRYIADAVIGGTTTAIVTLKPARAVAPLKPALMLPEVLDESRWWQKRLWWADANEPLTTLMFMGYVQTLAYVNTQLADEKQFKSYNDILDKKWKGKIVATDIRRGGRGGIVARFIYKHPDLGPRYLERLFSEMDLTLSSDPRQMVDWLAQGKFSLALFLATDDVTTAMEKGLPVAPVPADQFKEGAPIAPGGGAVSLADRAPHPNAAVLFINWLLSREGQAEWQRILHVPSLRTDIAKDGLYAFDIPKPGVNYVNAGTEEYSRITGDEIRDLVTKALTKAGK